MSDLLHVSHTVLSQEEFQRLVVLAQSGDIEARNTIIEHNIKLVLKNAYAAHKRLSGDVEDLIQFGIFGLIRAIEKYDITKVNEDSGKPYAFSTYATWWIKQSIDREFSSTHHFIRFPIHAIKKLSLYNNVLSYMVKSGIPLTDSNIEAQVAEFNFSKAELKVFKNVPTPVNESRPFVGKHGDETFSIYESTEDETSDISMNAEKDNSYAVLIEACKDILTPKEYEVIQRRFGLNGYQESTLEEAGDAIGVTRERVRQIQVQALNKLKKRLTRELGENYA